MEGGAQDLGIWQSQPKHDVELPLPRFWEPFIRIKPKSGHKCGYYNFFQNDLPVSSSFPDWAYQQHSILSKMKRLSIYCQMVSQLLSAHATDETVTKVNTIVISFTYLWKFVAFEQALMLRMKIIQCSLVNDEYWLKGKIHENLYWSIQLVMRIYPTVINCASLQELP